MEFLETATKLFLILIAPLWLILHYRSKKHSSNGLSKEAAKQLQTMITHTESMQKRIHSLELILDEQSPQWRKHG